MIIILYFLYKCYIKYTHMSKKRKRGKNIKNKDEVFILPKQYIADIDLMMNFVRETWFIHSNYFLRKEFRIRPKRKRRYNTRFSRKYDI